MADTVTNTRSLKIVYGFDDGDTRTNNFPNPKTNLTAAQIHTLSQTLTTNGFVIGDKNAGTLTGILTADSVEEQSTTFKVD